MSRESVEKITNITFRRNGVSGRPFWTGETKVANERLLIIRPDNPQDKLLDVECFVISLDEVEHEWRGDCYNQAMDEAIRQYRNDNNLNEG